MQRKCASVATTGLAERRRHGLANTPTSFTIRKDFAKIVILQGTTVNAKKTKEKEKSASRKLKKTKNQRTSQTRLNEFTAQSSKLVSPSR